MTSIYLYFSIYLSIHLSIYLSIYLLYLLPINIFKLLVVLLYHLFSGVVCYSCMRCVILAPLSSLLANYCCQIHAASCALHCTYASLSISTYTTNDQAASDMMIIIKAKLSQCLVTCFRSKTRQRK